PVAAEGVDVVPAAPDDPVERIRHVGRAVDGSADPLRELLPPRKCLRRALPFGGVGKAPRASRAAAAGCEKRGRDPYEEQALHADVIAGKCVGLRLCRAHNCHDAQPASWDRAVFASGNGSGSRGRPYAASQQPATCSPTIVYGTLNGALGNAGST